MFAFFLKLDGPEAIFYLILCIFIPPLFIVNLILFLIQALPGFIERRRESAELKRLEISTQNQKENNIQASTIYNSLEFENKHINMYSKDKEILGENLSKISLSYLDNNNIIMILNHFIDMIYANNFTGGDLIRLRSFLLKLLDNNSSEKTIEEIENSLVILSKYRKEV